MIDDFCDDAALQANRAFDARRFFGLRELGREFERHRTFRVMLLQPHVDEPVAAPRFEPDVAPHAGRHEPRSPIPAELTLLLANHRAVPDRVVEFLRLMLPPMRSDIAHCAVEADAKLVATGAQPRLHGPTVTNEH